jgi:hypothetical protein
MNPMKKASSSVMLFPYQQWQRKRGSVRRIIRRSHEISLASEADL